ncbi:hypothetical protein N7472_003269, partial [Penicillium cf. griseofulvum]
CCHQLQPYSQNQGFEEYDIKETPNVLYPICLGEVLNERYLIDHKLGFGGGSTVWMTYDLQDKRDVTLEVLTFKAMASQHWGKGGGGGGRK